MELIQLRQLVAISEEKTLSRAAEKLYISQSALSRSIQKLEDELGTPLFDRTKNAMHLNRAGLLCVEQAKILLSDVGTLVAKVAAIKNEGLHVSIVSCAPAPLWKLSAEIPSRLKSAAVSGSVEDEEKLVSFLLSEKADLAIVRSPIENETITSVPFLDEQLFMQIPTEHPLSKKSSVRFADLKGEEIHEYTKTGFWHNLHRSLIPSARYVEYDDIMVYMNAISGGKCLTFVTALANTRHDEKEGCVTIPIVDEEATAHYRLAFLRKNKSRLEIVLREETE